MLASLAAEMASKNGSPGGKSFISRKLFKRSGRGSAADKPAELPQRGFDLDSIPLDALGKMSTGEPSRPRATKVVVAIDFGTTYSGYAYSLVTTPDDIYLMMRAQHGQYGAINHKIPTILLLNEHGGFHSFGYEAREAYHDLDEVESKRWLYFEKFKMELHSRKVQYYNYHHTGPTLSVKCLFLGAEQENGTRSLKWSACACVSRVRTCLALFQRFLPEGDKREYIRGRAHHNRGCPVGDHRARNMEAIRQTVHEIRSH